MREYELVLMLDPGQDAPARDAVAQEAKRQIEADGTLKHENEWGLRKLAYEIAQRNEADYRWFRFEAPTELLEQLDHSLKIADGVLRFRIFKVGPETPVTVPPPTAAPAPGASRERPSEGSPEREAEPAAVPAAAAEPAPTPSEPAGAAAVETPAPPSEPLAEAPAAEESPAASDAPPEAEPAPDASPEAPAEDAGGDSA